MKTAFITGASSGIGRATARIFAERGYRLVLCGRRAERLESLCKEAVFTAPVHRLLFDVRDRQAVAEAVSGLPGDFRDIDILVNNAGNAHGLASFQDGDLDDFDAMIDGNVKGLIYVSKAVIPGMIARGSGHIINIGSVAGKEVYPNGNVYCASKFAVDALNAGMRIDLNGTGVKVSAVHPGLVETEFSEVRFKGDTERAAKVYDKMEALRPEDVAEIIDFMAGRPAHVNLADALLFPAAQAAAGVICRK